MWILGLIVSFKYFSHVQKRSEETMEINQNHISTLKCSKLLNYSGNILLFENHLLLACISHFSEQKAKWFKEWIQIFDVHVERMKRVSIKPLLSSVQFSRSVVSDSVTLWTTAPQASLPITNSQSLPKVMSNESVMPYHHHPLWSPSPSALNLSQPRGLFSRVSSSH